jgi:hypothetical protein
VRRKKSKAVDSVNIAPRGGKRGPKPKGTKEKAQQYADDNPIHAVDPDALAIELVPEPGARRELAKRIAKTLLEQNEALRIEVLAGSQVAARANNETMRIMASLAGLITTGPKIAHKKGSVEDDDGPEPVFVGFEDDAADDVDLNDALEKQFGTADGSD